MSEAYVHEDIEELEEVPSNELAAIHSRLDQIHSLVRTFHANVKHLPELQEMIKTVTNTQEIMARSAESMAETFKQAEARYKASETRYNHLTDVAIGRGQIPLRSHYWTLAVALLPTLLISLVVILSTLYITKTEIKASLTNIELNQKKNSTKLDQLESEERN